MKRRKQRNLLLDFKGKVATVVLRCGEVLAELTQQFDVHPKQIADWKAPLLERSPAAFGEKCGQEG